MGWSFRESVKILPGVRLSFSRRGVSASIGTRGLHLGVGGGRAPRVTGGFGPLHYYRSLGGQRGEPHAPPPRRRERSGFGWWVAVVGLLGLLIGWTLLPKGASPGRLRALATSWFAPAKADASAAKPATASADDAGSDRTSSAPTNHHHRRARPARASGSPGSGG